MDDCYGNHDDYFPAMKRPSCQEFTDAMTRISEREEHFSCHAIAPSRDWDDITLRQKTRRRKAYQFYTRVFDWSTDSASKRYCVESRLCEESADYDYQEIRLLMLALADCLWQEGFTAEDFKP